MNINTLTIKAQEALQAALALAESADSRLSSRSIC